MAGLPTNGKNGRLQFSTVGVLIAIAIGFGIGGYVARVIQTALTRVEARQVSRERDDNISKVQAEYDRSDIRELRVAILALTKDNGELRSAITALTKTVDRLAALIEKDKNDG